MHTRRSTFRCLRGLSMAAVLLGLCPDPALAQLNNVIAVQAAIVTSIQEDAGGSAAGSFSQGLQDGAPCYTVLTSGNFLNKLGWKTGLRWGREIRLPEGFDYSIAGRDQHRPLADWVDLGITDAYGGPLTRPPADAELRITREQIRELQAGL